MRTSKKYNSGFTIVELLIVIVVIGILAAISVVAYTGIQGRARIASIQGDLTQAAKQLEFAKVDGSLEKYPVDLAAASLKASAGTTYLYEYNGGLNSYCLVATNSSTVYHVTNDNAAPRAGGCVVTNLVLNPSVTVDSTYWALHASLTGGRVADGADWVYRTTRSAGAATAIYINQSTPLPTVSQAQYTASATVTSSVAQDIRIIARRGAGSSGDMITSTHTLQANIPKRIHATGVADYTSAYLTIYSGSGVAGDVITVDNVMFTASSSLSGYGDGFSTGWTWNGPTNNSTSSGPSL